MFKYFLVGLSLLLSGCVATTMGSEEVTRLQYGLAKVNKENKEALERLEEKEIMLSRRLGEVEEEVESLKEEVALNRKAIDKIEPGLVEDKDWFLKEEKENQLFQASYNDYLSGQYELASMGFKEYLRLYPEASRLAEAQYWLAESYFSQENFQAAISEFDILLEKYPESSQVAPSLYKKALALLKEEREEEALEVLQEIINSFPKKKEKSLAEELKKELEEKKEEEDLEKEEEIPKSQTP